MSTNPQSQRRPTLTLLVFGQTASRVVDKTLRIDKVNLSPSLLLRHALKGKEAHQLGSDTDTCGTCAKEKYPMICQGPPRRGRGKFSSIQEATQDDSSRALDIIIENWILPSVPLQVFECIVS